MTVLASPSLVLIAAVARNGVIGHRNALPWRLPGDLRHFKAATLGRPVLMGRRTFESIGKPLPGRSVVVVSRDPAFTAQGIRVAGSLDEAVAVGQAEARERGADRVMVAGGETLYRGLIDRADTLLITEVDLAPDGDAQFPRIDLSRWREASREPVAPGDRDEAGYAFVTWCRR